MSTNTAADPAQRIGIIGLGAMGQPMAHHLLAAHGSLVLTSSREQRDLVAAGAELVGTPRELAERVDAVLLMLPDLPQVEEVLAGDDGLLAADTELLLLIGSTSSPRGVRELDARLREQTDGAVRLVDCPVSGGADGAEAASLSIMLGGAEEDLALAARFLAPCGNPVALGPIGAGQVAKACNQLVVSATMLGLAESTVLAERSGLDIDAMWTLLQGGWAGGNLLSSMQPRLVAEDYELERGVRYLQKDLGFAAEAAQATDTHPLILGHLREAFEALVEAGHGDRDLSVARRFIAES